MDILRETGAIQWFETGREWPLSRGVEFDNGWYVPLTRTEVLFDYRQLGDDVVFLWDRVTGVAIATSLYAACASVVAVYSDESFDALRLNEMFGVKADGSGKSVGTNDCDVGERVNVGSHETEVQQVGSGESVDAVVFGGENGHDVEVCVNVEVLETEVQQVGSGETVDAVVFADGSGKSGVAEEGDEVVEYVAAGLSTGESRFDVEQLSLVEYVNAVECLSSVHCGAAVLAPDGLLPTGVSWLGVVSVVDGMYLNMGFVELNGYVRDISCVPLKFGLDTMRVYWPASVGSTVFSCYDTPGEGVAVMPMLYGLGYVAVYALSLERFTYCTPVLKTLKFDELLGHEMVDLGLSVVSGLCYMAAVPPKLRVGALRELGWYPEYGCLQQFLAGTKRELEKDYAFLGSSRVCHMVSVGSDWQIGSLVQPMSTTLVGGTEVGLAGNVESDGDRGDESLGFTGAGGGCMRTLKFSNEYAVVFDVPVMLGHSRTLESRIAVDESGSKWMLVFRKSGGAAVGIIPVGSFSASDLMKAVRSHMTDSSLFYAYRVSGVNDRTMYDKGKFYNFVGAIYGFVRAGDNTRMLLSDYSI